MYNFKFKREIEAVSRVLEVHHSIFYKMWEFGFLELDEKVPTAAVKFDKNNYKPLKFVFNPEFWDSMDVDSRAFIVAHECLHAILNHGARANDLLTIENQKNHANIAMDLAVNHMLVNSFGFDRNQIAICEQGCWVDTVFRGKNVLSNLSFEEYFGLLIQPEESKSQPSQNSASGNTSDDSGDNTSDDLSDNDDSGEKDSTDDDQNNTENESQIAPKVFDDHTDFSKFNLSDLIQKLSKDLEEEDITSATELIHASGAGKNILSNFVLPEVKKLKPSNKWEKLVKEWKRIGLNPPDDAEQWAKMSRRASMLPSDIILPANDESIDDQFCISKLNAWIFLDVSGSCIHLKDQFFMAYETISPKRFNKKMFIFADRVAEINSNNITPGDLYPVGSGTNFCRLGEFVEEKIKSAKTIPDIIMVITDGDAWHPESYVMPKKWHWFCENVSKNDREFKARLDKINPESHKHILSEYFNIS